MTHDLAAIAARVSRLSPDWQNPERFYEQRSQLAHELRRLAADIAPQCRASHLHNESTPNNMSYLNDTIARKVSQAIREADEAKAAVSAHLGQVPMGFDSAINIYSWGLRQIGYSDLTGISSAAAAKAIWTARARNGRVQRVAMDSKAADSYEQMFPGVKPARPASL